MDTKQILVTPEMIAVGAAVIDNHYDSVDSAYLARAVYIAMADLEPLECHRATASSRQEKSQ